MEERAGERGSAHPDFKNCPGWPDRKQKQATYLLPQNGEGVEAIVVTPDQPLNSFRCMQQTCYDDDEDVHFHSACRHDIPVTWMLGALKGGGGGGGGWRESHQNWNEEKDTLERKS